jgi:hypothetical protein
MKHKYDDLTLLSAYIDNELSDEERLYIERKLQTSIELRNKLEELKRTKELTSSCKKEAPANHYFEQRLMSALLDSKSRFSFNKKLVPAFAFPIIILMFLSFNSDLLKNFSLTRDNDVAISSVDLKPLLLPSEISNEDLFNFALYEEIPLNNGENQILKIGVDKDGKEYFEVKKSDFVYAKNNLNSFLSKLNLNETKKSKVDSLFKDYAYQLSKHILIGNDNSIALNSAVWNLRKALIADFISLTRQLDTKNFDRLASLYHLPISKNYKYWNKALDSIDINRYIVFTPDSVFTSQLNIENKDFVELNSQKKSYRIDFDSLFAQSGVGIKIFKSPDYLQVQVEEIEIPEIQIPDFNSFVEMIEKSIQPNLNLVAGDNFGQTKNEQQSRGIIFPKNEMNLDSVLELQNRRNQNPVKKNTNSEKIKSQLNSEKQDNPNDVNEELKLQLEKLREEIRKFREQFHNYIKEDTTLSKKEKKIVIDESIEI